MGNVDFVRWETLILQQTPPTDFWAAMSQPALHWGGAKVHAAEAKGVKNEAVVLSGDKSQRSEIVKEVKLS